MFAFEYCARTSLTDVRELLSVSGLPSSDIDARACKNFLLAMTDNDELAGVVGLEKYKQSGLLRSLAVRSDARNSGLGKELVKHMEVNAMESGIESLYLLTTTAEDFFIRLNNSPTNRNTVPLDIAQTSEFSSLCPDTAACLWKSLV